MPTSPPGNPIAAGSFHEASDPISEELVTISRWELEMLQSQVQSQSAPQAKGPAEPLPAPVAGAVPIPVPVPAIVEQDARLSRIERAYHEAVRDRELATALAGRPLVPGAAAQLIKLWRDDFDVYEVDGDLKVTARDGRAVGKAIAERLEQSEYAHFRPASSRGGVAARGAGRTPSPGTPTVPRTLGEATVMQWRESAVERSDPATGPVGLRRR